MHYRVESNKEPLQEASREEMAKALEQVLGKPSSLDTAPKPGTLTNVPAFPFLLQTVATTQSSSLAIEGSIALAYFQLLSVDFKAGASQ